LDRARFSDVTQAAEEALANADASVDMCVTIKLAGAVARKFELLRQISSIGFGLKQEEFVAHLITAGIKYEMELLAKVRRDTIDESE